MILKKGKKKGKLRFALSCLHRERPTPWNQVQKIIYLRWQRDRLLSPWRTSVWGSTFVRACWVRSPPWIGYSHHQNHVKQGTCMLTFQKKQNKALSIFKLHLICISSRRKVLIDIVIDSISVSFLLTITFASSYFHLWHKSQHQQKSDMWWYRYVQ